MENTEMETKARIFRFKQIGDALWNLATANIANVEIPESPEDESVKGKRQNLFQVEYLRLCKCTLIPEDKEYLSRLSKEQDIILHKDPGNLLRRLPKDELGRLQSINEELEALNIFADLVISDWS